MPKSPLIRPNDKTPKTTVTTPIDFQAVAACDIVIERCAASQALSDREQLADSLIQKGKLLGETTDAIKCFDDVVTRFANASELSLREWAAEALAEKAWAIRAYHEDWEQSLRALDEIIARFGSAEESTLRRASASALASKAELFKLIGRFKDAISIYDSLIERLQSESELPFLIQEAEALVGKGAALEAEGRIREACDSYEDVLDERFFLAIPLDPGLKRSVATAFFKYCSLPKNDTSQILRAEIIFSEIVSAIGITFAVSTSDPESEESTRPTNPELTVKNKFENGDIVSYDEPMSRDNIRDALEGKLDRLKEEYASKFGIDAAKNAFARRASASDGALEPGMVTSKQKKVTNAGFVDKIDDQLPEMSQQDLDELSQEAKANPWSSKVGKSPSAFISDVYKKWLGKKRLMREHFPEGARKLIAAYATEIRRHPERRLKDLGERPRTQHDSLSGPLPKAPASAWIPTAELPPEQQVNRRRGEAKKKRDQRARKPRRVRSRKQASKLTP